jgi:hypothetical protein
MNRSHRFGSTLLTVFAVLAILLGLFAPAGAARPVSAQATNPPLPFHPITIATTNSSAGLESVEWLQSAGDWVAYATGAPGCGHCTTFVTGLHLVNALNGRHLDIRGAVWTYNYSAGGGTTGIPRTTIRFSPPYLLWEQPGPPAPQGYNFAPGDFDCTLCLYNVETGQGGPATVLQRLAPVTPPALGTYNRVTPLDLTYDGRVLVVVSGETSGDHFYVVDLKTEQQAQIPVAVSAPLVSEAALLYQNSIAWIERQPGGPEGGRLQVYHEGQPAAELVDAQAGGLQHIASIIYWRGLPGLQYYDTQVPRPAQFPVIPGVTDTYAVDIGYRDGPGGGVGSTLAWLAPTPSSDTATTLTVTGSAGPPIYLQTVLNDPISTLPHASLSLGGDRVAYVLSTPTAGAPEFQIQIAWLVNPDPALAMVWAQADAPVAAGQVSRTWLWGPQPFYLGMEAYANPANAGRRMVEYFDKSRMEINNPNPGASSNGPGYVTNGLLVAELISNEIRVGETEVITARVPATIPVAGDPRKDNPLTPGYAALADVASLHGEHQAVSRLGQPVDETLDVNGVVGKLPTANLPGVAYAAFAPQTGHNIPDVFWSYLQDMGTTYRFDWTFVTGYPLTEAYWTQMRVGGHDYRVLIQAFQRRVLTYAPDFAPDWRVQQGNVGQHYFEWRYKLNGP